ncbi:MAG: hypothetical protein ACFFBD_02715 [Candidatus Hodarchaeota archaeon]
MDIPKRSIITGLVLAAIIIIGGIVLASFVNLQNVGNNPPVDLNEWANNSTTVLPVYLEVYLINSSYFHDNIIGLQLNFNYSGKNDWSLYTVSYNRSLPEFNSTTYRLLSVPEKPLAIVSSALKETVRSALVESITYDDYQDILAQHHQSGKDQEILAHFYGNDNNAIHVDILPTGIVVYATYHEIEVDWIYNNATGGLLEKIKTNSNINPRQLSYYFLRTNSYEEALQTSYITAWNSTLQTLIGE